jgi:hypothetical protein
MSQLADVFKLNPQGLNVRRAVGVAVVMVLPLIICHAIKPSCGWPAGGKPSRSPSTT